MRKLRQFLHCESGIAYLEFALSLPFLMALLLGGIEVTRYILITQKVEKVSITVSDVVAQSSAIGTTTLNQLVLAAGQVMQPYSFGNNAFVIISSVYKNGNNTPVVNWQYTGGGTWNNVSHVGFTGNAATLPDGFTMSDKENIIISEVFYNYQPMFGTTILSNSQLYKFAIFKPRLGDLTTLGP
ncbi:MAG: pilus assembly protein [Alphaproteobacteria bacterium]|nr:pilus assembly protein [Alphaproteobacteria bacterium]